MRKPAPKPVSGRKRKTRKRSFLLRNAAAILLFAVLIILFGTGWHFKTGLAYYLGFKSHKVPEMANDKHLSDVRNFQLLSKYSEKAVGLDVSQYQETIDWAKVKVAEDTYPLTFVFIRATLGRDKTDLHFNRNWYGAKRNKLIRGAYHYYRPNENSIEQANNFIKNVKLEKGDLPPVLDIEKLPENQSIDSLKVGLRRWLEKVRAHYKVKPIIYSGNNYYEAFLKEEFSDYTFWIANYNFFVEDLDDDWQFWQFTESAKIDGIPCDVDLNLYNGTPKMLQYQTIN